VPRRRDKIANEFADRTRARERRLADGIVNDHWLCGRERLRSRGMARSRSVAAVGRRVAVAVGRRVAVAVAAAVAAAVAGGCAAPKAPGPGDTLRAFVAAVERDDPRAAWLLLSTETRAHLREDDFRVRWKSTRDEQRAEAAALSRALAASRVHERAKLTRTDGRSVGLAREPAGWRLLAVRATDVYPATPEEALRRFVDALERRSLDGLLGLLSDPLRGLVERELADRLAGLKAVLSRPIGVEGDHARIQYGQRFHMDLVRDPAGWYVSDFN
jgi:hypothetical protein